MEIEDYNVRMSKLGGALEQKRDRIALAGPGVAENRRMTLKETITACDCQCGSISDEGTKGEFFLLLQSCAKEAHEPL